MGIYLPNMEMPKSCLSCPLQGGTADCRLTQKTYNWGLSERPSDCPLVSVPPHGRLGDLDEINEKHDKLSRDFCHGYFKNTWDFVCAARKIFYDAPTIIEEER